MLLDAVVIGARLNGSNKDQGTQEGGKGSECLHFLEQAADYYNEKFLLFFCPEFGLAYS